MAFCFLANDLGSNRWKAWYRECEDDPEAVLLHPAIIEAVATAPTGKYRLFEPKKFFNLANKIAADKYGES